MSLDSFKPTLLLAQMVLSARYALNGAQWCNTDITIGLKEKGDQIDINTMGSVTTFDTSATVPMTYSDAGTTATSLTITVDKTAAINLSDKDKIQIEASAMSLEQAYGNRMIYELNDDVDSDVYGKYTEITTDNYETGTTSWQWGTTPTAAEIATFFASVHKDLDDNGVPTNGRFISLPNIAIQGIRIAMGTVETNLGDEVRVNGLVAERLQGFTVFQSNNVVEASSVAHGIAGPLPSVQDGGVPGACALAIQISPNVEKLRLEGFWADGIRARVTSGAKVFKPARMIDINLNTNLLA